MENELHKDELVFFDLLESTDFEELNERELILVGKFCSEEEYKLQRKIVVTAGEEQNTVLAAPLVLPSQKAAIVIPLYQAILAVASVIIFFILIWIVFQINIEKSTYYKHRGNFGIVYKNCSFFGCISNEFIYPIV